MGGKRLRCDDRRAIFERETDLIALGRAVKRQHNVELRVIDIGRCADVVDILGVDRFQPNGLPDARTGGVPNGIRALPVDALLACGLTIDVSGVADHDNEFVIALLQSCRDVEREC